MSKLSTIFLLIFLSTTVNSFPQQKAEIIVRTDIPANANIDRKMFGAFFEFLWNEMNGSKGMYAQEIMYRGFDRGSCYESGVACGWLMWVNSINVDYRQVSGGFNKRGNFSQKIAKTDSIPAGICQEIWLTDTVAHNFYIHMKGSLTSGEVYLGILDENKKELLFKRELGVPENEWKKFEIEMEPLPGIHHGYLVIFFEYPGEIYLDEISLIPLNHVGGMRIEYYEQFKKWRPGIIRYPGG